MTRLRGRLGAEPLPSAADVADMGYAVDLAGQRWHVVWHAPSAPPPGAPHGAEGICVTVTGEIVLVSGDGRRWAFPAGRPEPDESWQDTLRREVLEEACATIRDARLLGFAQGTCLDGPERGLVLVRSVWRADVDVLSWNPHHEIRYRRLVDPEGLNELLTSDRHAFARINRRAVREADIGCSAASLDERS